MIRKMFVRVIMKPLDCYERGTASLICEECYAEQ